MRTKRNILIFPGGTEVGMEIYKSLVNEKFINLYSVSSSHKNHAPYIFKKHFVIDDVFSGKWIDELNEVIESENIDLIFPAHAYVLDALAENEKKIKAQILANSKKVLDITRSKKKTYSLFGEKFPVPRVYETIDEVENFPVFAKPDNAYGAQGAIKIDSPELLKSFFAEKENYVFCEYLPGEEYTVDCYSDKEGKLLFCEGRTRERIRMGTSMHSESVSGELDKYFRKIGETIASEIRIKGPWFFQMKKDVNGVLKLLEIEPRVAGTMAFHRVKGINFPLLYVYETLGYNVSLLLNNFDYDIDRALVNRYRHSLDYSTVYIDLDDTIIVNDKINLDAIKFLYQCINENKKIILLSKSLHPEKEKYLEEKRISDIFDEVIWLSEDESKADYIDVSLNPIFIDDSFSQRKEVNEKLGIPTFDTSMIEILFDERK